MESISAKRNEIGEMESERKKVVALRNRIKMSRPKIIRQESWRYKRITSAWRRPKGITSRMRNRKRGWPRLVSAGFGTPKILRDFHPSGYKEVLIQRLEDLDNVDQKKQAVRIGAGVGKRKRIVIIEKANSMNLKILNPGILEEDAEIPEAEEATVEKEESKKVDKKTKK